MCVWEDLENDQSNALKNWLLETLTLGWEVLKHCFWLVFKKEKASVNLVLVKFEGWCAYVLVCVLWSFAAVWCVAVWCVHIGCFLGACLYTWTWSLHEPLWGDILGSWKEYFFVSLGWEANRILGTKKKGQITKENFWKENWSPYMRRSAPYMRRNPRKIARERNS